MTTKTNIEAVALSDEQEFNAQMTELAEPFWLKDSMKQGEFFDVNGFARALLASKPAAIGALERTEIFRSNLQRTREQWEKCDPEAMSKMSQAAVFHALNDAKRDVLMMHALLAEQSPAPASPSGEDAAEQAGEAVTLPPLPAPLEIDWPELHSQALGCGVEDRNIRDRYEAAEYGWQDGVDRAAERVPEQIFTAEQMQEYARQAIDAARAKDSK